ncbi:MAG: hypothetical protein VX502_02305 [Candidatus Thermoplasmatota archaeon]|nr:hypothetical protein [Candidatus Thermoplasmatota archaeon]
MHSNALVAIFVIAILMPMAASHGANEVSIVMRSEIIQPSVAEVLQNDSLVFNNAADYNRTIRTDVDGDGEYDQRCETEPKNASLNYCSFWIDPTVWKAGNYQFDIFSNGTLWKSLNMTVMHDYHEESGPPSEYDFNTDQEGAESKERGMEEDLRNIAIILFIASGLVWLARRGEHA